MAILTLKAHAQGLRHVRKTVTFTGAAGLGEAGTVVPVFDLTGRVRIEMVTAFCTETLVSTLNLGTISLGTASAVAAIFGAYTVGSGTAVANDWWDDDSGDFSPAFVFYPFTAPIGISESIIINPLTQNITDGTLIIDCWYLPITDGGALVAA